MSYSTEAADLLTKQLQKFATLNRHQLAGQAANFHFWMAEVQHCLASIDGYERRFNTMSKAQRAYVDEHQTVEFNIGEDYWKASKASGPRRISDDEMTKARQALCDAAHGFLDRCLKEGFIDLTQVDEARDRLPPKTAK
jgi:hypothetical protein